MNSEDKGTNKKNNDKKKMSMGPVLGLLLLLLGGISTPYIQNAAGNFSLL